MTSRSIKWNGLPLQILKRQSQLMLLLNPIDGRSEMRKELKD